MYHGRWKVVRKWWTHSREECSTCHLVRAPWWVSQSGMRAEVFMGVCDEDVPGSTAASSQKASPVPANQGQHACDLHKVRGPTVRTLRNKPRMR